MAYTILVCDDNSLYGSHKENIMQREKLFNKLWILAPQYYNGYDMAKTTLTMRYILPISNEFKTETLVLSEERYEDCLKYALPVDTNLTKEYGDIELNLTFTMIDADDDGNVVQRVRKTGNHMLHIAKIPDWDSVIPDSALSALDQRIIALDLQMKKIKEMNQIAIDSKADSIKYNEDTNELQLLSGENEIGNKVILKDYNSELEDGVPIVDFGSSSEAPSEPDDDDNDNVVEF